MRCFLTLHTMQSRFCAALPMPRRMRCFLTLRTMQSRFCAARPAPRRMRYFLMLRTMAIPFLRRSTSAAANAVERTSFPPAPPVIRSPPARKRKPSSLFRPRGVRAADFFAHLSRRAAHKLRTNAKTGCGKCSDLHNLKNHSQKVLYKCGSPCYLNISNNSCY